MKSHAACLLLLAAIAGLVGSSPAAAQGTPNCRMMTVTNPLCGIDYGRTCFNWSYPCWSGWFNIGTCSQRYCFTDYSKMTFRTCELPLDCDPVTCDDNGITRQVNEEWYQNGCQQKCTCTSAGEIECSCNRRVRKEIRQLDVDEFAVYAQGINTLKESGEWQQLVDLHTSQSGIAHGNDGFWPWHRAFLHHVESRLQEVTGSCSLAIPYYEWSIGAADPWQSGVFSSDYFGSNEASFSASCINDGPFAGWTGAGGDCIRRGQSPGTTLLDYQGIRDQLASSSYTSARQNVEYGFLMHGSIHGRIGGHMRDPASSPYDPIFYSHHAMVDKLWDEWQTAHPASASNIGTIGGSTQYTSFGITAGDTVDLDGDAMCVTYGAVDADGDGDSGGGRRLASKKSKKKKKKKKLRGHEPGSPLDKKELKRNVFAKWLDISAKQTKDRWVDKRERGDIMRVAKQVITGMKHANKRRRGKGKGKKKKNKSRDDDEDEVECVRTCPLPDMDVDNEWIDRKQGQISEEELKSARRVLETTQAQQASRVRTDLAKPTDLDFCFNVADFFEIEEGEQSEITEEQ